MPELAALLTLQCPNCGANLSIRRSVEDFACGYCGANVRVEREGGVVSLSLLTEAIGRVQRGTDKAAAELAIVRLRAELDAATETHFRHKEARSVVTDRFAERLASTRPTLLGNFFSFLGFVILFELTLITPLILLVLGREEWAVVGVWMVRFLMILCLVASGYLVRWRARRKWAEHEKVKAELDGALVIHDAETDRLRAAVEALRTRIREKQAIADE